MKKLMPFFFVAVLLLNCKTRQEESMDYFKGKVVDYYTGELVRGTPFIMRQGYPYLGGSSYFSLWPPPDSKEINIVTDHNGSFIVKKQEGNKGLFGSLYENFHLIPVGPLLYYKTVHGGTANLLNYTDPNTIYLFRPSQITILVKNYYQIDALTPLKFEIFMRSQSNYRMPLATNYSGIHTREGDDLKMAFRCWPDYDKVIIMEFNKNNTLFETKELDIEKVRLASFTRVIQL